MKLVMESWKRFLSEGSVQIPEKEGRLIAAAAHVPDFEDINPSRDPNDPAALSNSWNYEWYGERPPPTGDEWADSEADAFRTSWTVGELREAPRKLPGAPLGWYVIEIPPIEGKPHAIEGVYTTEEEAMNAADKYAPRDSIYW
jgi:hypothetical protein